MTDLEPDGRRWRHADAWICLALACATIAAYSRLPLNGFINYDDNDYVTENVHVQAGFTRESVVWAFTTLRSANWHPLTWLSHMGDCALYGLNPAGHHMTSLLFHVANTLLLFWALRRMTGARGCSAFVAGAFALHPLHVESVAWVAERKDVLSTFFWMLAMVAYAGYARRPALSRYVWVFLAMAAGLLAKPMLVTLPCALLLLDYWPLGRRTADGARPKASWGWLVVEKIPLFLLAAVSSLITLYAQKYGGAMPTLHELPIPYRFGNAVLSYGRYLEKTVWPLELAVYYPHPWTKLPMAETAYAGVALVVISVAVLVMTRRRPYLLVGWLWYLGTLVPVIGIVQVGGQAMADRYTYIPLIGVFIMAAWGFADLASALRIPRRALVAAGVSCLAVLGALTWREVGFWRTNDMLFERALAVTGPNNMVADDALGLSALSRGDYARAMHYLGASLRANPNRVAANDNYGVALADQGRYDEAIHYYQRALQLNPGYAKAENNWGNALIRQGHLADAITHYRAALDREPDYADALNGMGNALITAGKSVDALAYFSKAVACAPNDAQYHLNLAVAMDMQGDTRSAVREARTALRLDPKFMKAIDFLKTLHQTP